MVIAGRYRLEREVGRGGMGAVWLAHDEVLARRVAVKRLGKDVGAAEEGYLRAQREARIAATLAHPHIVSVLDLVTEGEQQWLVMEYVEGENLADLVRREGALSLDRVAALLLQVTGALTAAHDRGIVHRDIKPSNILVDTSGRAKVNDFGIARSSDDDVLTQTGLIIGSPAYLAPEIVSGRLATSASDVWALGATAFFAVTGRAAYESDGNLVGLLHRIASEPPPRTSDAGWLAPLLSHTMVLEPAERWRTREIADFLRLGPGGATDLTQPLVAPAAAAAATGAASGAEPQPLPEPEPEPEPRPEPEPAAARPMAAAAAAASAPASSAPASSAPASSAPAASPPPPAGRRRSARRTGSAGNAVLAVLVVLLLAVAGAAWFIWSQLGADDGQQATTDPSTSLSVSASNTPTPSASETPQPTAEGMERFIRVYLATATSDQAAAWEMLTPEFQSKSASFESYRDAWRGRPKAAVSNIDADPDDLSISYDVQYSDQQNDPIGGGRVTLRLVFRDGDYLIAGES